MSASLKKHFLFLLLFFLSNSAAQAYYFNDNFDSYTSKSNMSSKWNYVPPDGVTLDQTGGHNGSKAIKFTYNGETYYPLTRYITEAGTDQVYIRFKFKVGANARGGIKFLKIFGVVSPGPSYANWTWNFGEVANIPSQLPVLCYGDGASLQNDTAVCHWGDFYPVAGQWHEVTTYNRYSTNGASNGEMWIEIDGNRVMHFKNVKNRNDSNSRVIDKVAFGDYSNRFANMTLWFDDIEISDSPFTVNTNPPENSPIQPPVGLRIVSQGG